MRVLNRIFVRYGSTTVVVSAMRFMPQNRNRLSVALFGDIMYPRTQVYGLAMTQNGFGTPFFEDVIDDQLEDTFRALDGP